MTEAEQERAAVVYWLRTERGKKFTRRERLLLAWWCLRYGELVLHCVRVSATNFIERGDHIKDTQG